MWSEKFAHENDFFNCGYAGIKDIDELAKASHCEPIEETIKYNFGVSHNYRETIGKIAMIPEHGRVRVTDFEDRDLSYTERMARIDMEYGLAQLEESECSDDDSGKGGASVEDPASLASCEKPIAIKINFILRWC